MIDISKQTVKINCPECNRGISVSIGQIAQQVLISCICGQEIRLNDKNGTNKKAIRDINESFQKLENTLKRIGK